MNTNEASLSAYDTREPISRGKPGFRSVLNSMECTARWLENGRDGMEAAAELRLAMQELKHCIADCEVSRNHGQMVAKGWKIVPVEPAEEMIQAACLKQSKEKFASYAEWLDSHSSGVSDRIRDLVAGDYRAMLAAAPSPAAVSK